MSRNALPSLAIEWCGKTWRVFDAQTGSTAEYAVGDSLPFGGREAILGVGRRNAFVRSVRVPNGSPDEIRMILGMRLAELFPSINGELAYDFQLTSDVNAEGRLAVLAAIPASELRTVLENLRQQSIRVTKTVPVALGAGLAASNAGLQDAILTEERSDGVTLDVVVGGELRASRIATPGTAIEVELKRTASLASAEVLPVITVGGVNLPSDHTSSRGALESLVAPGADRNRISLELPEAKAQKEKAGAQRYLRLGLILVLTAILAGYFIVDDRSSATAAVNKEKSRYANAMKKLKAAQSSAETALSSLSALDNTLTLAFAPAQKISDMVTLVSNSLPKGAWLTGISAERGKPLLIRGTALDRGAVDTFISRLRNEARLRNLKLLFANGQKIEDVDVVQFSIEAFPVGNLPIVERRRSGLKPATPAASAATSGGPK